MKNCLVLLTKIYPFDSGEEFIENEIPVLAKEFEKVILIATSTQDRPVQTRRVPENVSVFHIPASQIRRGLPRAAVRLFPFTDMQRLGSAEEKKEIGHSLRKRMFLVYFSAKAGLVSREAEKILLQCRLDAYQGITFYSYWFFDTALAVGNLKKKFGAGAKRAVSRAHGYDLYASRNSMNYLPLRRKILSRIDRVYPCSQNGSDYLKTCYPEYADKIETAYLGTMDCGLSPAEPEPEFHLVSCCHISPVKRVELLAQALSGLEKAGIALKWTHFGGGENFGSLKQYAREHLGFMRCEFPGEVKNAELMRYYRTHHCDFFVNTSSSEGLPVSIMEACSFGIPAIATDVGGTAEIVREGETGFLLPADVAPDRLAEKIREAAHIPEAGRGKMKEACRKLWAERFSAERNFASFAKKIQP